MDGQRRRPGFGQRSGASSTKGLQGGPVCSYWMLIPVQLVSARFCLSEPFLGSQPNSFGACERLRGFLVHRVPHTEITNQRLIPAAYATGKLFVLVIVETVLKGWSASGHRVTSLRASLVVPRSALQCVAILRHLEYAGGLLPAQRIRYRCDA